MSTTYKLTTPINLGTLTSPTVVNELKITSLWMTTTPGLAPLGSGEVEVTLTETTSGWQEIISYQAASLVDLWADQIAAGQLGDVLSAAIFARLVADGKLPSGTVETAEATTTTTSTATTSI